MLNRQQLRRAVRRHQFAPDPNLPVDHKGRAVCVTCHSPGAAGDAKHPVPGQTRRTSLPEVSAEARELEARMFGERADDE